MNSLAVFILAFALWLSKGLYLRPIVERLSMRTNEIAAYWTVVSIFDVVLAIFVTLLCPNVYFLRWSFPVRDFLILFAFAVLSFLPAIGEFHRFLNPQSKEEREMVELIRKASFIQLAVLQIISAVLPEELVFRYVFLGLLSLWNPFAGLIAVSIFFGLSHKFSHPERGCGMLVSNVLTGFVLSLGYLYTKSVLVVMAIHWLGNMIPWALIKYERARKTLTAAIVLLAVVPPIAFWDELRTVWDYLKGIYSPDGLLWGVAIGGAMPIMAYAGVKLRKKNSTKASE
ncbi:CPBP family intramembrane metalloprotease [Thermococcus sp. LS1]|uniref:CPBP family intramembrane glutamic endopeptidase n=1 Tax=Thermococcus sp. LS1 TaxID=1638259 RepID=UPI00143CBEC5|nr:type II CAAX endopeptidase family protein [Thermococcus sp. LS1]NJD99713.1 CPBP family intramembrane metalloprotease [Thermococcus sp. LS1]